MRTQMLIYQMPVRLFQYFVPFLLVSDLILASEWGGGSISENYHM